MHQLCLLNSKHIQSKRRYAAFITCYRINQRYTDNIGDIYHMQYINIYMATYTWYKPNHQKSLPSLWDKIERPSVKFVPQDLHQSKER